MIPPPHLTSGWSRGRSCWRLETTRLHRGTRTGSVEVRASAATSLGRTAQTTLLSIGDDQTHP
jgi:hypothetical protein